MDLPLASPELDHGVLRDIISPCSTIVRDGGYSPPPTRTWKLVFSSLSKEVYMSTSSVTHQPHLSSFIETLPMDSYSQIKLLAQIFPLNFIIEVYPLLF
jgi:hypothetical protein